MGHFCYDRIIVTATASEWTCIEAIVKSGVIELVKKGTFTVAHNHIICENKYNTGIDETALLDLSSIFPCAVFCWCSEMEDYPPSIHYYVSGKICTLYNAARVRDAAVRRESQRFLKQPNTANERACFLDRFEEPTRALIRKALDIGHVPSETSAANLISFGDFHASTLTVDGQIVCCGLPIVSHQKRISARAIQISCGRYHTAVLLENGTVQIWGAMCSFPKAIETPNGQRDVRIEYPVQLPLVHNDAHNRAENCKSVAVGDALILKKVAALNEIEAFTSDGASLGLLKNTNTTPIKAIIPSLKQLNAYVSEVSPQCTKKLSGVMVCIAKNNVQPHDTLIIQKYTHWRNIVSILSVFDGIFGLNQEGQVFQDGYCGEYSLKEVIKNLKRAQA